MSETIIHFQGGPSDGSKQLYPNPVMPVIRVPQFGETQIRLGEETITNTVPFGWAVYEVSGTVANHRGFEKNAHQ